uniref:Uncharacterized protein n=1 Tax=Clytia hemisphaerica TaxID=252671 RepID=A0A7M5V5T2_9CNID
MLSLLETISFSLLLELRKNHSNGSTKWGLRIQWKQAIENAAKSICDLFPDSTPEEFKKELKERILAEYQLIGDNIDFEQIVRHQSKLNQNKSIHWFHYMDVKERFHSSQGNFFEDWRHKLHLSNTI